MTDRLLENDTALKILSVLIAIAIWVQVNSGVPRQVDRRLGPVPVTWLAATNHYTVLGMHPASVTILIKGSPTTVTQSIHAEAWVDLAHITKPGTYSLPVSASVPPGTSLVSVTPVTVTVTVDSITAKKFNITTVPQGHVASGYGIVAMTPVSTAAEVSGPSRDVAAVAHVEARVNVSGQTSNLEAQVTLVAVNAAGHTVPQVTVSPSLMDVAVTVSPEKTLPVIVKYHGAPGTGFVVGPISVDPSRVTVFGPASTLSGMTSVDTNPVTISGRTASVTKRVHLALPSGVTASPSSVRATVSIGP